MNVAAHQEKEKNEKTGKRKAGEKLEKKEDNRSILQKLRAALLRSFREQHDEKNGLCEGSARGNWDPREDQQPLLPNPNGVWDRTTTLRRLLIGAV